MVRVRSSVRCALVAFSLLALSAHAFPQDVRASAKVDSNNILIGKWVRLTVEVDYPEQISVRFPLIADSLNGLEIVKQDTVHRTATGGNVVETATFVLTAFDSGTYIIPPLQVPYRRASSNQVEAVETSPIPIFVHGIDVDTSKGLRDIKPPMTLSITFAEILPYLIGFVAVVALIWLGIHYWKKRKRGESLLPEAPPRPAHEIALDALRSLEAESLWQRGKVKEYHSRLSDIIRVYCERRFRFLAMEMVTDEILREQEIRAIPKETRERLREILVLADLVKFAKLLPLPDENERSIRSATAFVEGTWRTTTQTAESPAAQPAGIPAGEEARS